MDRATCPTSSTSRKKRWERRRSCAAWIAGKGTAQHSTSARDRRWRADRDSRLPGFCLLALSSFNFSCHNYEQMWSTTSLRGLMMADLRVDILSEAVHSGMASGIVPSSFRILRQLLDRIEDPKTGKLPAVCYAAVPAADQEFAKKAGAAVGDAIWKKFPFVGQAGPVSKDPAELVLGGTWMPALSITGVDGMPSCQNAGNVLRSHTTVRLSLRTPPSVEPKEVAAWFKQELERDSPYGAKVTFTCEKAQKGWTAPPLAPWLGSAMERASQRFYGKGAMYTGEGGSIPFMSMLGDMYPETQFVITGVLGPSSNAHGPNEFLHIDFTQRLVGCVASILTDHYAARVGGAK